MEKINNIGFALFRGAGQTVIVLRIHHYLQFHPSPPIVAVFFPDGIHSLSALQAVSCLQYLPFQTGQIFFQHSGTGHFSPEQLPLLLNLLFSGHSLQHQLFIRLPAAVADRIIILRNVLRQCQRLLRHISVFGFIQLPGPLPCIFQRSGKEITVFKICGNTHACPDMIHLRQCVDHIIMGMMRRIVEKHIIDLMGQQHMIPEPQMPQIVTHPLIHRINIPVKITHQHPDRRQLIGVHGFQQCLVQRQQLIKIHDLIILIVLTDIIVHGNVFIPRITVRTVVGLDGHQTFMKIYTLIQLLQHRRLISACRIHCLKKDIYHERASYSSSAPFDSSSAPSLPAHLWGKIQAAPRPEFFPCAVRSVAVF